MIDEGKHSVLGVLVNAVDYDATVEAIIDAAKKREPLAVSALAVHGVMTGVQDAQHNYRLNRFDYIVPDGQPVRWALRLLHGVNLPDRVYGPTLTLKICERAAQEGLPIYLYGSKPDVLEKLTANLQTQFPGLQIAGMQPSKFRKTTAAEKDAIAQQIADSGAVITFVGLGCPRQEVWAYEYHHAIRMPAIAVGAAFDFHAGNLPQAPAWMQNAGLEWFYRLLQEPRRLWKRYVLLNPAYLWLLFLQITRLRRFDPYSKPPPDAEVLYG